MLWMLALVFLAHLTDGQSIPFPNHMFEYGADRGDQKLLSDSQSVEIGTDIIFGGKTYTTAYINKDGIVSFGRNVAYDNFDFESKSRDPDNDPAFLAPFYFDGQSATNEWVGTVYYRLQGQEELGSFVSFFQTYLGNATVGVESFVPKMSLIVTWENVTDRVQIKNGDCAGTTESPCLSSTFQLVITASEDETIVIFNYLKMDVPIQSNYQAGINSGHGIGWTSVCTGCDLADLPSKYSSSGRGGYIFRVTNELPERGGCSDAGRELQIYPRVVEMYGGALLEISGPCSNGNDEIFCKFGTGPTAVKSPGFRVNYMTYKCPVPRLILRGWVPVSVSVDDDNSYSGYGSVFVVRYGPLPKTVDLVSGWYDLAPDNITMTWDPSALSLDSDVRVDIKLVGYRETETTVIWKDLRTLAANTGNSGKLTFRPGDYQCSEEDCILFEIGVVEVTLQKVYWTKANIRTSMNGGVLALGWYVNRPMTQKLGADWPSMQCERWYNQDRTDMRWMEKLLYCPCNVDQALADFGRWQPDVGCNMFSASKTNCYYHKGAKHCVRSFQPSSTGAGNQCCYGDDGLLSYAADTFQGSTPDKAHDWGAFPYNKPGYVPSLSHWIQDVITFYYCCLWNNYTRCDRYMDQRATRDCNGYLPSKAATAFGDPHILTFDGKLYNFGGKGDFTLLKTPRFTLQGKFKARQHDDQRGYNATVLTSVAMKGDTGDRVEIRLAAEGIVSNRRLDVFVNGKLRMFDHRALSKQDFNGVSIINNDRESNYTVLLHSGVGVQAAASHGLLHVVVNVPPDFRFNTSGLMGTLNDAVEDDFTTKNGILVDASSSLENIYTNFGKSWKVTETESLFTFHNVIDDEFVPVFTTPSIPAGTLTDIDSVCQSNAQCRFDYILTGSRDVAAASRRAQIWFEELQSFQKLASSCGLLNVPYSTKDNYNYTLGNTVTVTGCRNPESKLMGTKSYTCSRVRDRLQWVPSVNAKCESSNPTKTPGAISGATRFSSFCFAFVVVQQISLSL